MHDTALAFARTSLECQTLDGVVLEVGSLNINGSVRALVHEDTKFIGLDLRGGECVDVQANGARLPFANSTIAMVISCGTLEHTEEWKEICLEMCRVLKSGGLIALSTHNANWPRHSWNGSMPPPEGEYYGSIEIEDLSTLLSANNIHVHYAQTTKAGDVLLNGVKI